MSKTAVNWTKEQQQVIESRGCHLLVSAAAGSGKTAVLVERIIRMVTEGENPRAVAIMGLPGCVMYAKRTIFDLVLPRVMADEEVTADELAALGMGGLCLNCPVCTFPNCGFGKGY